MTAAWFRDAVIYEIYPQSFHDTNADGIGDLRGVIERLDYIAALGVDAIWFNPCFESPFVDAGYDVADYLRVAPRYGTNDDLVELVDKARERGIRILLDLVVGHTSTAHAWFQEELAASGPNPDGDRYIWTTEDPGDGWGIDLPGIPAWVASPGPRPGWYLKNFYDEQPALNFGWTRTDPAQPWRDAIDAPGPTRNRQALKDILDFWLSRGIAGFRVDMAFSLVKDEYLTEGRLASARIWQEIREWLDTVYPDAVLIPEGDEPRVGGRRAFDADFALVIFEAHASLFDDHSAGTLPWHTPHEPFFAAEGAGSTETFLRLWEGWRAEDPERSILLATADHDFNRLRCGGRTPEQLGAAFTFLFTWGSVPSLYYGDEIGMRYLPGMPNVEGAVCNPLYNRAGARTPMQWDDGPNAGFSTAAPKALYLPIDPEPDRPTVAAQDGVPGSTLTLVRDLLALRRATPALQGHEPTRVVHEGYPFAWMRGHSHLVVVNPRRLAAVLESPEAVGAQLLWGSGVTVTESGITLEGFGYGVFVVA
ncbi:alpha-amylase family glycosyl hydrolase [Nostocoides australiense]|nr:alpha-amylase family glycosyl hydrolase [Tetrasphaera australiensis]HRW01857.1 alpha-amylase family glycosyl hydrolase [Tetrasphaera sp.]